MVRKRSWPAVSQSWSLTSLCELQITFFVLHSTPMVFNNLGLKVSSVNLRIREVFPTPEFPTTTNLKWQRF